VFYLEKKREKERGGDGRREKREREKYLLE